MKELILVPLIFAWTLAASAAEPGQRPGYGVVEAVTPVQAPAPLAKRPAPIEESASSGASAPPRTVYRVRVRMDDGSVQVRELRAREFKAGDRVLLTNAGDVVPD